MVALRTVDDNRQFRGLFGMVLLVKCICALDLLVYIVILVVYVLVAIESVMGFGLIGCCYILYEVN